MTQFNVNWLCCLLRVPQWILSLALACGDGHIGMWEWCKLWSLDQGVVSLIFSPRVTLCPPPIHPPPNFYFVKKIFGAPPKKYHETITTQNKQTKNLSLALKKIMIMECKKTTFPRRSLLKIAQVVIRCMAGTDCQIGFNDSLIT